MKEEYKIEDLKPILKEIIEEEQQRNNIKIDGDILTIKEYYKSDILKNKLKLIPNNKTIKYLMAPLAFGGWYDIDDKKIVILISNLYSHIELLSKTSLAYMILKMYHEIRHVYQTEKMTDTSIEKPFFIAIEKSIIRHEPLYYNLYHDYFLTELDAEIDSTDKTKKYLEKKSITTEENISYLDNRKEFTNDRLKVYNKAGIFEKFNFILQKKIKKQQKTSSSPLMNALNEITDNNNLINTLSIIYNQDGSFKSIKEIMNNLNKIDKNIISTIISSKAFMKSININEINSDEIKYMIQALEIIYQEELSKLDTIKKVKEEELTLIDETIHNEKKLMKKLKKILSLRSILMNLLLNKKKIEEDISLYDYIRKGKSK